MIKAIIFDFGGVLTAKGHLTPFAEDFAKMIDRDPNEVYRIIRKHWNSAKIGSVSSGLFWKYVSKEIGCDENFLKEKFTNYFKQYVDEELLAFIKTLKGRYKLVILSNTITEDFSEVLKDYSPEKIFDHIILSCNVKMSKPDPEIFKEAVRIIDAKPEECIFIDDQEKNTIVAERLGFNVILYTNLADLKKQLKEIL